MTEEDEEQFLAFLRQSGDIQLFVSFAPSKEELLVNEFVPGEWQFLIWNKAFSWVPEYDQVTGDKTGQRQGWYYVRNSGTAPAIEYSRQNFSGGTRAQNGRIYWTKYFSAPRGLSYDVEEFDKWYCALGTKTRQTESAKRVWHVLLTRRVAEVRKCALTTRC